MWLIFELCLSKKLLADFPRCWRVGFACTNMILPIERRRCVDGRTFALWATWSGHGQAMSTDAVLKRKNPADEKGALDLVSLSLALHATIKLDAASGAAFAIGT